MYGKRPLNDLQNSRQRLERILSSRRLIFNPYTVSDQRLMEIVSKAGWGNEDDIVEAVVMTFTRLRTVPDVRGFDGVYAKIGQCQDETFIHAGTYTNGITAFDSLTKERSMIGKLRITNVSHVASLVGKRVFVSRIIRGRDPYCNYRPAYRMTRLTGNLARDAAAVRNAMCEAKIEMLLRVLAYPECSHYLNCSHDFFDYKIRILRAISVIEGYSLCKIPGN